MIEKRTMTNDDFLAMMEANADSYPEFAELPEDKKRYLAQRNTNSGEAVSYWEDGELLGVGGVRYVGFGEAWMVVSPQVKKKRALSLLRTAKKTFAEICDKAFLWRVFATSRISQTFLKHMKFEPEKTAHVWTRSYEAKKT